MQLIRTNAKTPLRLLTQFELPLVPRELRCLRCPCNAARLLGNSNHIHNTNSRNQILCDFTCTAKPQLYVKRVREVGGLSANKWPTFLSTAEIQLPAYIPMLHPRRLYPNLASINYVAITIYDLFRITRNGTFSPRFADGKELRKAINCQEDCRIILSGVQTDVLLEQFWRHFESQKVARLIAQFGIEATTIPNFSFFTPMPAEHSYYNIRRMQIVASELINTGVRVIPHLNATCTEHWEVWTTLFREQPHLQYFCKEFQTGNKVRANAEDAATQLIKLQDRIGRSLSMISVGGYQHLDLFRQRFKNVTLIDSQVIMKSVNSQTAIMTSSGQLTWHSHRTPRGQAVENLFLHNYSQYTKSVIRALLSDASAFQQYLPGILQTALPRSTSFVA